MLSVSRITTGALVLLASFTAVPEQAGAQLSGSSCQRLFDLDPSTPESSEASCFVDGLVQLGAGQDDFFNIFARATVFETPDSDFGIYEVQLNLQASGAFPDGFVFGHAEVRDGEGDLCEVDIGGISAQATCEDMFSFDSGFSMFAEAFTGRVP
jgi:hypothetical protein